MIHFICALKCEAKILIRHYQLKHCADCEPFPLYLNLDKEISLTICGIGKINAAAATAFTHAFLRSTKQDIWLNVGIAGHKNLDIGEIALAHKIIDKTNHCRGYPQIIFDPPCLSLEIVSHNAPTTHYTDSLFDMEAAGFYATACRFASSEFIHVIKIISDNEREPTKKISEAFVTTLIKNKLNIIEEIVASLRLLASDLDKPNQTSDYYEQITEQWRFTHAQRILLKACLNRWYILCAHENPMKEIDKSLHAKEVIHKITKKLDVYPIKF